MLHSASGSESDFIKKLVHIFLIAVIGTNQKEMKLLQSQALTIMKATYFSRDMFSGVEK